MKKKVLALLLVAAIFATVLAGCNVITKNEERDYKQVVSTVTYNGHSATVTKQDVVTVFNSYGYYYVYYYGYTYEEACKTILESLTQRKLLILYAKDYFAPDGYADGIAGLEAILSAREKKIAIENVNADMEDALKTLIEDLEKEEASNSGSNITENKDIEIVAKEEVTYKAGDEFDLDNYELSVKTDDGTESVEITTDMVEGSLPDMSVPGVKVLKVRYNDKVYEYEFEVASATEARPVRPSDGEVAEDPDEEYTGELPKKFTEQGYVSEQASSPYYEQAVKTLNSNLASNYTGYDEYYEEELETMLLAKLQRKLASAELTPEKIEKELSEKAAVTVAANKETFSKSDSAYSSALTSGVTGIGYHQKAGYGFVYNILLQFSDEQTAMLKKYAEGGVYYQGDEIYKQIRDGEAQKITVNIANLEYDPEYECEDHDCGLENCTGDCDKHTCGNAQCPSNAYIAYEVDVQTVLGWIKADLDKAAAIADKYERQMAILEVAAQWTYRVNEDSGMFASSETAEKAITNNGLGYLVTPEGEESTYVEEFTEQGRALIKKGIGSYMTGDTLESMYCVTDYGIHILVVSYIPYDFNAFGLDGESIFASQEEYDKMETPMDYIVSFGRLTDCNGTLDYTEAADGKYVKTADGKYVLYDASDETHASLVRYDLTYVSPEFYGEDGELKESKATPSKTYADIIRDTIESNTTTDVYNAFVKKLTADNLDKATDNNDKLLKKIASQLESAS